MSAYLEFEEIRFQNPAVLVDALKQMYQNVETGHSLSLYGYEGKERPERAQIVVRRHEIGAASNDLGFRWDAKAKAFIAIISEYDARTDLNQAWRDRLQVTYSKVSVARFLQRHQGMVQQTVSNAQGTIIRCTVEV